MGATNGQAPAEDRYKKFYGYVKGKEMAPVIDAFKAGYNGETCDKVKSRYRKEFDRVAGKKDLPFWAERQQAYCLSGKLEKAAGTGNVSYDPINHEQMTIAREDKVRRIAQDIPPAEVDGPEDADILMVGWGSTYAAIRAGTLNSRKRGVSVAHVHLRHLNPFPPNLGDLLRRHDKIIVPELNRGQLSRLIQAEYLVPVTSFSKIQGLPFKTAEIERKITAVNDGTDIGTES